MTRQLARLLAIVFAGAMFTTGCAHTQPDQGTTPSFDNQHTDERPILRGEASQAEWWASQKARMVNRQERAEDWHHEKRLRDQERRHQAQLELLRLDLQLELRNVRNEPKNK